MHAVACRYFACVHVSDKKSRNLCLQTTLFNYRTSINNEVRSDRHLLRRNVQLLTLGADGPTCGDLPSNFPPVTVPGRLAAVSRSLPVSPAPLPPSGDRYCLSSTAAELIRDLLTFSLHFQVSLVILHYINFLTNILFRKKYKGSLRALAPSPNDFW